MFSLAVIVAVVVQVGLQTSRSDTPPPKDVTTDHATPAAALLSQSHGHGYRSMPDSPFSTVVGSTEIVCCLLLPRQYALDVVSIMTATWVMSRTFLDSDRRFQVRSHPVPRLSVEVGGLLKVHKATISRALLQHHEACPSRLQRPGGLSPHVACLLSQSGGVGFLVPRGARVLCRPAAKAPGE